MVVPGASFKPSLYRGGRAFRPGHVAQECRGLYSHGDRGSESIISKEAILRIAVALATFPLKLSINSDSLELIEIHRHRKMPSNRRGAGRPGGEGARYPRSAPPWERGKRLDRPFRADVAYTLPRALPWATIRMPRWG